MSEEETENAFKLADKVNFSGKPTVIAISIIYYQKPELYPLIMLTNNITTDSLQLTTDKLKSLK